eukprot:SAG22_NODE_902_length_6593_cov_5.326763_9_plen_79_part_00
MAEQAQQCIVTCTNVLALYPNHLDALLFRGMARTQAGPLKVRTHAHASFLHNSCGSDPPQNLFEPTLANGASFLNERR